jgi:DNA-binding PadR family transcriptional regulator
MTKAKEPTDSLPLTPVVLHVLVALASGNLHGYAISQDVEQQTGGAVRLGPGTLYGSLQRLVTAGLIREVVAPADAEGAHAERRRYYAITAAGRRVLRADAERLAAAVRLTRARLGPEPERA